MAKKDKQQTTRRVTVSLTAEEDGAARRWAKTQGFRSFSAAVAHALCKTLGLETAPDGRFRGPKRG